MFKPKVALIQGASKGIGAEFTRKLLRQTPEMQVIATSRNPLSNDSALPKLLEEVCYGYGYGYGYGYSYAYSFAYAYIK